ncbi:MAG: RluA family pseudouridine synthase [Roseivirga sp.]
MNGEVATTATFITGGETIELTITQKPKALKRLIFTLDVLFEDEYLAVIHKPAGILVSGNGFKTIAHALPQNLRVSPLPDATQPQPVHRLDYATTGALLVGKTSSAIRALNDLFAKGAVGKVYYAIAIGEMPSEGGITSEIDGKPSESHYEVAERVESERFGRLNLVKLKPKTGRRHQLRKHLASIGNPILGDSTYGTEGMILKRKGLYLHAYSLQFVHPVSQQSIYLADDLPQRFRKIFPSLDSSV